jgi:hypothetical protein
MFILRDCVTVLKTKKLGTATYFKNTAYEIRISGGKNQSNAQGVKSKNPRDSTLPVKTAGAYADAFSIGPELMQNH